MKSIFKVCLLGLSLIVPSYFVNAQAPSILEDTYITSQELIEAEVVRVKRSERILVVRGLNQGKVREFYVPEDAEITVRGQKARFNDMRRGDSILVTMSPRTERIVIARIKVPETDISLDERRQEPVAEELPAALPQTASQWYGILFLGLFAGISAAFIRFKRLI